MVCHFMNNSIQIGLASLFLSPVYFSNHNSINLDRKKSNIYVFIKVVLSSTKDDIVAVYQSPAYLVFYSYLKYS